MPFFLHLKKRVITSVMRGYNSLQSPSIFFHSFYYSLCHGNLRKLFQNWEQIHILKWIFESFKCNYQIMLLDMRISFSVDCCALRSYIFYNFDYLYLFWKRLNSVETASSDDFYSLFDSSAKNRMDKNNKSTKDFQRENPFKQPPFSN